ncbi:hypothetical protein KC902_01530 [Candidatus Kaiserbacteria bacterium]|nr:hypothetical protein [Candidatus Kaiserbacteria bacterium]USN88708.1 MAG: hypothetical protein H6780_04450 [Candidatus Nomurabacteria bacterium]
MDQGYERDRIKAQMEQLQREHEQLNFTISREKNSELYEVEKLKREFKRKIETAENRQREIQLEIANKKIELTRIENRLREAAAPNQISKVAEDRARRRRF